MELITGENDKGRRLDRILRKALPDLPLPLIHRLLRQGRVFVNGKSEKMQYRPDAGAKISIPTLNTAEKKNLNSEKTVFKANKNSSPVSLQDMVLWENHGLIAFNKPAGLAVHGPNSLDIMVQSWFSDKLPQSLSFKSGPLHRLDKPSSGIVVFSASLEGARFFSSLLHERKIKKSYLAIIEGRIEKEEIWQDELFRDKEKKKTLILKNKDHLKTAVTKISPAASTENYSLIRAEIETGRTHQIRAQAAFHGHPLMGDVKYGGQRTQDKEYKTKNTGFFLHARKLEFLDYSITAPLPKDFIEAIKRLFGNIEQLYY